MSRGYNVTVKNCLSDKVKPLGSVCDGLAESKQGKDHSMEIVNLVIAVASLIVAAVAGIYIPIYLHRDSQKRNNDN